MSLENVLLTSDIRTAILKLNAVINGGGNNTGEVTLTAAATSTTVTDTRASNSSVIILMPTTANAAAAITTTYFSATLGSFTLTHANNAQIDRTFKYAIVGA